MQERAEALAERIRGTAMGCAMSVFLFAVSVIMLTVACLCFAYGILAAVFLIRAMTGGGFTGTEAGSCAVSAAAYITAFAVLGKAGSMIWDCGKLFRKNRRNGENT